jgi:hypothetical protein
MASPLRLKKLPCHETGTVLCKNTDRNWNHSQLDLTLSTATSIDLTNYYFRHVPSQPSSRNVDWTDYYFRHA